MTAPDPMDRARWSRVNDVFHRALERPPAERDPFVQEACRGDLQVVSAVRALLDAHERAGDFLDTPVTATAEWAQPDQAAHERLVGRQIGQYRIDRILGQGGMGVVYLAEDLRLGRMVALKAVSDRFTQDPVRRDRLRREARAAAALLHSGIATVFALEEIDQHIFIAGEYVAGETLRDEMSRGPSDLARVADTAVELAQALAAAHDRGVVHRDLKPENIMRGPSGRVKILDFGLARMRDLPPDLARLTGDGLPMGTPAYMAPEQIRGGSVDHRADLFALGLILSEMLSGAHPFAGHDSASTMAHILEAEPAALRPADGESSSQSLLRRALDGVVRTCLRKTPAARFASAHDLLAALERARGGGSMPSTNAPAGRGRALRWWKFHQGAAAVSYAMLLWPLWLARGWVGGRSGLLLFLTGVVVVAAALVLRLHLWFTAEELPEEWRAQRAGSLPWMRTADGAFVTILVVAGLAAPEAEPGLAALLVGAAVAILISFTIIEPATTRVAFRPGEPP